MQSLSCSSLTLVGLGRKPPQSFSAHLRSLQQLFSLLSRPNRFHFQSLKVRQSQFLKHKNSSIYKFLWYEPEKYIFGQVSLRVTLIISMSFRNICNCVTHVRDLLKSNFPERKNERKREHKNAHSKFEERSSLLCALTFFLEECRLCNSRTRRNCEGRFCVYYYLADQASIT